MRNIIKKKIIKPIACESSRLFLYPTFHHNKGTQISSIHQIILVKTY